MKLSKLQFVLSNDFFTIVKENIAKGADYVIRIAERRYTFRHPKADMMVIDVADVDRAIGIMSGKATDRFSSVYMWLVNTPNGCWSDYRKHITATASEYLWAVTGVYKDDNAFVEKEFNAIASTVLA